jgi:SAM-dependent methyltransferase
LGEVGRRTAAESAALARLYDLDLTDDPGDLDLYLALATRTGGPVLELGAGTGRLTVPLAVAGHAVTAVDNDPAMIERGRRAATAGGREAEARIEFLEADLVSLRLPAAGSFRLAFIPLNTFLALGTREAQRAALATLAAHLAPGGLAVVDAWQPNSEDLARFDGRLVLEYARLDPETGRAVTKIASAQHDAARQGVTLTTIFEEGEPGSPPDRWLRIDRLRLVSGDELRGMAEDAGLEIERLAGGYDLEPIGPGSDRAVLVAVRP